MHIKILKVTVDNSRISKMLVLRITTSNCNDQQYWSIWTQARVQILQVLLVDCSPPLRSPRTAGVTKSQFGGVGEGLQNGVGSERSALTVEIQDLN